MNAFTLSIQDIPRRTVVKDCVATTAAECSLASLCDIAFAVGGELQDELLLCDNICLMR